MAKMDVVQSLESVAAAAYMTIRPSSGIEWAVHSIGHAGTASLSFYDGTNELTFEASKAGPHCWNFYVWHVTNTYYMRVKNEDGTAKIMYYDGVVTR